MMSDKAVVQFNLPIQEIRQFCEARPVQRMALFGSVLRDDFTETSDIDFLIEYLPQARVSLLDMASQEIGLSQLIGRAIDLRTASELSPYFRQDVLDVAQVIYERNGK